VPAHNLQTFAHFIVSQYRHIILLFALYIIRAGLWRCHWGSKMRLRSTKALRPLNTKHRKGHAHDFTLRVGRRDKLLHHFRQQLQARYGLLRSLKDLKSFLSASTSATILITLTLHSVPVLMALAPRSQSIFYTVITVIATIA